MMRRGYGFPPLVNARQLMKRPPFVIQNPLCFSYEVLNLADHFLIAFGLPIRKLHIQAIKLPAKLFFVFGPSLPHDVIVNRVPIWLPLLNNPQRDRGRSCFFD